MHLYIHGSEITVCLGKFLCLAQFYSMCPSKFWALSFHVFSNSRDLPMHTGWFICLFLYKRRWQWLQHFCISQGKKKKTHNETSDKWGTAYAPTAIVGSNSTKYLSVCSTWAEAKQCWTQALNFRMCQVLCWNTSFQSLSCSCLASGLLLWCSCGTSRNPGKENTLENLYVQKDGEWDTLKQAKRNPDFLLLYWRSPSSLYAGQVWKATVSEHGVSTWLLIKGFLSNNLLHISKSCCQEPWTSMGWKTTDKADAEKSNDACIGQSECY